MLGETAICEICKCTFRVAEKDQTKCNVCKKLYPQGVKKNKEVVINAPRVTEEQIRKIVNEEIDKRFPIDGMASSDIKVVSSDVEINEKESEKETK
jgi:hypothetical protein